MHEYLLFGWLLFYWTFCGCYAIIYYKVKDVFFHESG